LGAVTGEAATGRDSVYFSRGMGQDLFHEGIGKMGGVNTGRSERNLYFNRGTPSVLTGN